MNNITVKQNVKCIVIKPVVHAKNLTANSGEVITLSFVEYMELEKLGYVKKYQDEKPKNTHKTKEKNEKAKVN